MVRIRRFGEAVRGAWRGKLEPDAVMAPNDFFNGLLEDRKREARLRTESAFRALLPYLPGARREGRGADVGEGEPGLVLDRFDRSRCNPGDVTPHGLFDSQLVARRSPTHASSSDPGHKRAEIGSNIGGSSPIRSPDCGPAPDSGRARTSPNVWHSSFSRRARYASTSPESNQPRPSKTATWRRIHEDRSGHSSPRVSFQRIRDHRRRASCRTYVKLLRRDRLGPCRPGTPARSCTGSSSWPT